MKTPSPGEAKQGMTFDIARGQNTEKQAIQNLIVAQLKIWLLHNTGGIWLQLELETKKFHTARPIGLLKRVDHCE